MIGKENTGAEWRLNVAVAVDCRPSGSSAVIDTVYWTAEPFGASVRLVATAEDAPGATGMTVAGTLATLEAMLQENTSALSGKDARVPLPSNGRLSTVTAA